MSALASSFIETKALVGSGIRVPGEDANDEQKTAFLTKVMEAAPTLMMKPDFENAEQSAEFFRTLGMPEEATGYDTAKYEDNGFDESREEILKALAHGAGLTTKQYKNMAEGMLKADHEALTTAETTASEEMSSLRQEWGMTWKERRELANKVRETFFDFIPEAQMDAKTIKALHAVATQLGSGGNKGGLGEHRNEGGGDGKMTPADALARIDEIMDNKEHPYWIPSHPNNAKALNDMIELRKMADPDAGTYLPKAGFGA